MNWLTEQASLYRTHADNYGLPVTFRQVLLCPSLKDLEIIIALRALDRLALDYKIRKVELKSRLSCFTPAAMLKSKAKGEVQVIAFTYLMQLDFDWQDISEYDIEELKQAVFALPFVAFCGLSCSGDGFYALVAIAEPERLAEYAEHCFIVLESYGIKADTSKGKKVENLRYVSYDSNMLIRENPEPLRITRFKTKSAPKRQKASNYPNSSFSSNSRLISSQLEQIRHAVTGQRWATVQRVAYTLGGLMDPSLLYAIKSEIESNPEFNGEETKYCKCAGDCFEAGKLKPIGI